MSTCSVATPSRALESEPALCLALTLPALGVYPERNINLSGLCILPGTVDEDPGLLTPGGPQSGWQGPLLLRGTAVL